MKRIVRLIFGTSLVVGTAVALASPADTKPLKSTSKFNKPATTTTNRMQKRPPAAKPAGGTQLEYAKPSATGGAGGAKVNSTLIQKGPVGAGNNKNSTGNGNGKFKQNTVNNAGWDQKGTGRKTGDQLGGSHGDDTPAGHASATGGASGAGKISSTGTDAGSADLFAHPAGSSTKPHGAKSTAPAKTTSPVKQ